MGVQSGGFSDIGDGVPGRIRTSPSVGLLIGDQTAIDLGIAHLIKGAKIDHDIDKISYAEVYFENLNPQLMDDVRWAEDQGMQIWLQYASHSDYAKYQGVYRMSNPKFGVGRDSKTITIRGLGDGVAMVNLARRRVFESMTYSQIATEVVEPYGYTLQTNVHFRETIPSMTQDGVSDYAFLKKIATAAGLEFFVWAGNAFLWNPAIREGEDPIIIRADASMVKSLDFEVVGDGQAAVVVSSPVDPLSGKSSLVGSEFKSDGILDVGDTSEQRFTNLSRPTVIYRDARGSVLSQTALQATVDAEGARRKQIVKVRGVIEGAEQIMPRKLVGFVKCGSRFVGPYYITRVVHEITTQGVSFITRFEGVRASTGYYRQAFGGDSSAETTGGTPEPFSDASGQSKVEVI